MSFVYRNKIVKKKIRETNDNILHMSVFIFN